MPETAPITLCGSLSLYPSPLGAAMHNAAYRASGLDYSYVPFSITEQQLPSALEAMRTLKIRGLGVSMPFKLNIMPLLDELDPLAKAIGAVNTVVNNAGKLKGHNTDAEGALRALREHISIDGAPCLIFGAGGAARAVAYGLCQAGAQVHLTNRTQAKAELLAENIRKANIGPHAPQAHAPQALKLADYPVIINASSVGMPAHPGIPFDPAELNAGQIVMDIVYKPVITELIRGCRSRGVEAIHGARMLLFQAAKQFELYTEVAAPLKAMNDALAPYLES